MAKTKLTKNGATIYVDSGQVTLHEKMGWKTTPEVTLQSGVLSIDGVAVKAPAAGLNGLDIPAVAVGTLENVHMRHYQVSPAAISATAILAATRLSAVVQTITTNIIQPDVPRTITIKGNAAGLTGDVVINGTNIADEAISDTIALNGASEVAGVKAFKTITSIVLPVWVHANYVAQQETATAAGSVSTSGQGKATVTATDMSASPKKVNFSVTQGTLQKTTATVGGGPISTTGAAKASVHAAAFNGGVTKDVAVPDLQQGQLQVNTATAAGTITTSGAGKATVTAAGMNGGTPKEVAFSVSQGVKQKTTATVVSPAGITAPGDAKVTVTAVGVNGGTPKDIAVPVIAGTLQALSATAAGTITVSGNGRATVLAAGMNGGVAKTVDFAVSQGVKQLNTATIVSAGGILTDGSVKLIITAAGFNSDTPKEVDYDVVAGVAQKETQTVVAGSDITGEGLAKVVISATGISTQTVKEYVEVGDTATEVATALRAQINLNSVITNKFTVGGTGVYISLTSKTLSANDASLNIAIANDTCTGLTDDTTSDHTTAGVAQDTAATVAAKGITALGLDATVTGFFTVGGTGADITLTAKTEAAYDATMNIESDNKTATGLTHAATSVNSTHGVAHDGANEIGAAIRAALTADAVVGHVTTGFFTVSGSNATIILTAKTKAANDATMNLAIADFTCTGISAAPTSTPTATGYAQDTAASVATKMITEINKNGEITGIFTVGGGGGGATITLERKVEAANEAGLNIATADDSCSGLTAAPTSSPTTAGVAHDGANQIGAAIRAALIADSVVGHVTTGFFTVTGSNATIILTAKVKAAQDASMNTAIADNSCVGITAAPTSTPTTSGIAQDTATTVAAAVINSLGLDATVAAFFTIGGSGTTVTLTAKAAAANDATLNLAIVNNTCVGLTDAPTSSPTIAGVAPDGANQIGALVRAALIADANIGDPVTGFFTVTGSNAAVILTANAIAVNDTSMSLVIANDGSAGITTVTSVDTTPGSNDKVSLGRTKVLGIPQIVKYAACVLVALFKGSADAGSLAVDDDEVEKNLYTPAGTLDGSPVDLYYLA